MATYRISNTGGSSAGTSDRTVLITPAVGDLLVAFIAVAANTNNTPTCSDNNGSGTYDLIGVGNYQIGGIDYRLSMFIRTALMVNTTSTTITFATGSNSIGLTIAVAISSMTRVGSGAVKSIGGTPQLGQENDQAAGTPAPTFPATTGTGDLTLGVIANGTNPAGMTIPTSWTERQDIGGSADSIGLEAVTRNSGFVGTTITWGSSSASRFASMILELDASSFVTKTQSVDASISTTTTSTITNSLDVLCVNTRTKTQSIDVSKVSRPSKTHSIDGSIKKTQTKTTAIDASVGTRTKTHSIDSLSKKTQTKTSGVDILAGKVKFSSIDSSIMMTQSKTHSVDVLRATANKQLQTHSVDAFLFFSRNSKTYAAQALLQSASVPVMAGSITSALTQPTFRPRLRLSRVISRNSAIGNVPTIAINDAGNALTNDAESLIDGYNRSSMKFGFADSDATTNDNYRIIPDIDRRETENYIERQKVPWISNQLSSSSGALSAINIDIHYTGTNQFNMVELVTDQYGKGDAGIATNIDVSVSNDGSSWTAIATGKSGFSCPEPHRFQLFYYYDYTALTFKWSTNRDEFMLNSDEHPLALYTSPYIRITIHSISVDASASVSVRPRHALIYEAGAYLWDTGIQEINITTFNVQEDRDLSTQTLSPIGTSNANTFSLTGTVAEKGTPYYLSLIDPDSPNHDQFQNALYIAVLGVQLGDLSYGYLPYGTFLADEMSLAAPDGTLNISGRDFSKLLQETKMPSMFYQDVKLHEVIRDIVERAGIEDYSIDTTVYTLQELATGITKKWLSDDDWARVHKANMVWSQDQTCWEFLQTLAYADLGVFYFDRNNTFIYKAKEDLLRRDDPVDFALTEEDNILTFNSTNEIMKNSFAVNYKVPDLTKRPVGVWDATDNIVLDSTSLTANVTATATTIHVGDVSDWVDEGYVQIDSEIIKYHDKTDSTFETCERGWLGTRPTAHTMANSSAKWNFGAGSWSVSGGVLTATVQGGSWGTTLTVNDIPGKFYNFYCTATINAAPYAAGIAVRANGVNNHYLFVFKSVAVAGLPGATAASDANIYALYEVVGGTPNLLKGVAFGDQKWDKPTGHPMHMHVQVDDEHLSMFLDGSRIMNYNIQPSDLQIVMPAKVGFAARGAGPTVFENAYVTTLPEAKGGEAVTFSDAFGKPIYEIRRFDVDYTLTNNRTPPCSGVQYFITNSDELSMVYFQPGPFTATMYVKNDVDRLAILAGGTGEEDTINQSFYLTGHALDHQDQRKVDSENAPLIARYGRQELNVNLPWVQSDTHAKFILDYLKDIYSQATLFLDATIHPNPEIQLGDIVSLSSTGGQFWLPAASPPKFYVVGITTAFGEGGLSHSLRLRSI